MWSTADRSRRLSAAVLLVLAGPALMGCGFRPLYGEAGDGNAAALASVKIDLIANRAGQRMHNLLLERLSPKGPPANPLYRLSVKLTESKQELALRKDESATRTNLTVRARYNLIVIRRPDLGHLSGTASSTNSYNVLDSEFATLSAENDARKRALIFLAEEIRLRVAAGLRNPQLFVQPSPKPEKQKG